MFCTDFAPAVAKQSADHAAEDHKRRELVEARNQADSMVYQMEKLLKEQADKLTEADKSAVQAALNKVRDKAKGDDTAAIKLALDELQQASHALSKHLYERAAGGAQAAGASAKPGDGSKKKGEDEVIDAEFEVKE